MGIEKWVKQFLKKRYRDRKNPAKNAFPKDPLEWAKEGERNRMDNVLIVDMMQYMKHKPEDVRTLGDLKQYIMSQVRRRIDSYGGRIEVIILCFDQKVTDHHCNVVKTICYKKRYKNVDFYPEDGGPYLPKQDNGQLPPEWNRFCGNSNLLRRELFPIIYNCCLDSRYIQLRFHKTPDGRCFGQTLILQGLPGLTYDRVPGMKDTYATYLTKGFNDPSSVDALKEAMQSLVPWSPDWLPISKEAEEEDRDMYNRVYFIKAVPPGVDHRFPNGFLHTDEWKDARNNLGEADLAMMYFDRFYANQNQIIDINDGDIFPISLLYAPERINGNTWRNRQLLALPKKGKKKKDPPNREEDPSPPKEDVVIVDAPRLLVKRKATHTYCDVNILYSRICDDPLFGDSGVQNHALMLVFMIILSGTDFFKDSFGGIGVEKIIWKTLTGKFNVFHHLVQSTKNIIPDPLSMRAVVIDEVAWREFAYYCYVEKHGKAVRTKLKRSQDEQISLKDIKVHLSKRKYVSQRFPERNLIRRWGRQILWNLEYWLNGPRYKQDPKTLKAVNFPDPFLRVGEESYYGYEKDYETGTMRFTPRVTTQLRVVDEVYSQHFKQPPPETQPRKKRKIVTILSNQTLDQLEHTAKSVFK